MSERSDKEGPAKPPALIPPMGELEKERKIAIDIQVRAAIEDMLTKGGSVSEKQLRKWEHDGIAYFFRLLRERVNNEMRPAHAATSSKKKPAADRVKAARPSPPSKPPAAKPEPSPVSTERDWVAQQRRRWSVRTRALVQGVVIAVTLFVGATVFIRLWPVLTAEIQQRQYWR